MRVSQILQLSDDDMDRLRAELHPVDPESVRVTRAPRLLRWLWPAGIRAMATPGRVFLDPALLEGDPARIQGLVVHELVHVRQWADYGRLGFLRRYLAEYLRGRRQGLGHQMSYRSNRLEVEASQVAGSYITR